jgi:hypothetical protein
MPATCIEQHPSLLESRTNSARGILFENSLKYLDIMDSSFDQARIDAPQKVTTIFWMTL